MNREPMGGKMSITKKTPSVNLMKIYSNLRNVNK